MVKVKYNIEKRAVEQSFQEFCDLYGLTVNVHERSASVIEVVGCERWYANFNKLVEIVTGGILISVSGNGNTPEQAVVNLAWQLSGKVLRIGGPDPKRVLAPNKWREI